MPAGTEYLLTPPDAGPFATKQVAIRALGCHQREADAILKELGIAVFKVGVTEFISERDLHAALAERRRIALGIPSAEEAVERAKAMTAEPSPERQALIERMDSIGRQIEALRAAIEAAKPSTPTDDVIGAPAPAPQAAEASPKGAKR